MASLERFRESEKPRLLRRLFEPLQFDARSERRWLLQNLVLRLLESLREP